MQNNLLVICSCPADNSMPLARLAVENGLAACTNILPNIQSVYRWQGKVETADESLLLIKTTQAKYAELEALIMVNHPYDVPEILAIDIAGGLPSYLQWLTDSIKDTE